MNIKKINYIILCGIIITSCSGNSQPAIRDEVYNIASDSSQVSYDNNEKDSSLSMPEIIEDRPQIEEKEEPKNQTVEEPTTLIKTKKFYGALLDGFCKKYFDRKFPGTHYVPGSINVDNVSEFDSNTIVVKGTHSFKSPIILRNNKIFKAFIREDGNNRYHIDFQRYAVRFGGIKSTGSLLFYYNPEE